MQKWLVHETIAKVQSTISMKNLFRQETGFFKLFQRKQSCYVPLPEKLHIQTKTVDDMPIISSCQLNIFVNHMSLQCRGQ